jgi:hypothetical protein
VKVKDFDKAINAHVDRFERQTYKHIQTQIHRQTPIAIFVYR